MRALVTGAGRGIGRAIALALARHGHPVALVSRTRAELEEVAAGCANATIHTADLTDAASIDALAAEVGDVEILVNNAGAFSMGNPLDGDPDEWTRLFALNVLAPMRLTRRFAPGMVAREQGVIVNLGSVAAIEPMKMLGAYAASKHALRGWSLSAYERLREHGIKVVLINPAYVDTPMSAGLLVKRERLITPDDVAAAMLLAITTSPACCPSEITLRLTKRADG